MSAFEKLGKGNSFYGHESMRSTVEDWFNSGYKAGLTAAVEICRKEGNFYGKGEAKMACDNCATAIERSRDGEQNG